MRKQLIFVSVIKETIKNHKQTFFLSFILHQLKCQNNELCKVWSQSLVKLLIPCMTCGDQNLAFELTFYVYTFSQGTAWKFVQLIVSTFQVGWNKRKKISLFIIFQSFFYNQNINQLFSQNIHKQMKNIS